MENVVARLERAGLTMSPEFVRDVVEKYLEITAKRVALAAPGARDELVKRVASSLYEEASVIRRVVEEVEREPAARGWRPPAAAAGDDQAAALQAQLAWGRYWKEAADIVAWLAEPGLTMPAPLSALFVADVADRYFEIIERQPTLGAPGVRRELAERIAASLDENPDVIQHVVAQVERQRAALDRRSWDACSTRLGT